MPQLPFQTERFPHTVPSSGTLLVPRAEIAWGAITVGVSPVLSPFPKRPLIEMAWRGLMALSSLDTVRGRYTRSASYDRLDPSEKSAVSYFLGMTQAKVTLHRLLGITHLAHLDPVLTASGRRLPKSRPDLIGIDPRTGTTSVAVEAKGRTNSWNRELMRRAKSQAGRLPGIMGAASTLEIASAAWFDIDKIWNARLEDPPRSRASISQITLGTLMLAYYSPILDAAVRTTTAPSRQGVTQSSSEASFELPDVDLTVSIDNSLLELWSEFGATDRRAPDIKQSSNLGDQMLSAVRVLPPASDSDDSEASYRGPDGVAVHLGPTWFPADS